MLMVHCGRASSIGHTQARVRNCYYRSRLEPKDWGNLSRGTFRMRSCPLGHVFAITSQRTEWLAQGIRGDMGTTPLPPHFPAELLCKHIFTLEALVRMVIGLGSHLGSFFCLRRKIRCPIRRCSLFYLNLTKILEMEKRRERVSVWEIEVEGGIHSWEWELFLSVKTELLSKLPCLCGDAG